MTLRGMLFDLDGTLIDSGEDLAVAYNELRKQHKLPPLPLSELKASVAYGINHLICRDFNVSLGDNSFNHYRREFTDHYTANLTKHTRLFDGVSDLLAYLDKASIPWGIVTNKPKRFAIPIVEFFPEFKNTRCLIAGDTLSYAKPHAYPMHHACNSLGTAPIDTGMMGDTEVDIHAAHNAGCHSFAVTYGYQHPDAIASWNANAILDHPMELTPWFSEEKQA